MTQPTITRHTADSITDPVLDALYAERDRLAELRSLALDYLETSDDTAVRTRETLLRMLDDGRRAGPRCGNCRSVSGETYPPCARPAGHIEAYCRSADRAHFFLAADLEQSVAERRRVRALADRWARLRAHGGAAAELRDALDGPTP